MKQQQTDDGSGQLLYSPTRKEKLKIRLARVTYQRGCAILGEKEPLCVVQRPKVVKMIK